jgi:DNA-binding response OmpR family regulator
MADILLLEDNESFRQSLVENLEDEGHTIHEAGSGNEAIALGATVKVDLLITDVRMAGIDGIDALAGLRELHPDLKSIVITGFASDDAPARAIGLGACDYIYKPFKLRELLSSINRTLNSEEESQRGQATLAPLLAGYKRLVVAVTSLLSNSQLKVVESQRRKAYTGLFVAIRSRSFELEQALKVWDVLEDLETRRQGLKEGKLDLGLCRDLAEGYKWVLTIMKSLEESASAAHPMRPEGKVSRERFAHFYEAVQAGRIPAAQLPLGPFLRGADALSLEQSTELHRLYSIFWGEP